MLKSTIQKSSIHYLILMTLGGSQFIFNISNSQAQTQITFEDYKKQCLAKLQNSSIKGKLAQDVCNCTIAAFEKRYSLKAFNQVVQKSNTDKAIAKQLAEVGEDCFEKYLYE